MSDAAGLSPDVDDIVALMHAAEAIDSGDWIMRCPAHEGASASLEVTLSHGRYQLLCRCGCKPQAIMNAALARLGLDCLIATQTS
jgi:hypothetical protein